MACRSFRVRRLLSLLSGPCSGLHLGLRASRCLLRCRNGAISSHLFDVRRGFGIKKGELPSVMFPRAALMPPCAATVCDLVGNYASDVSRLDFA